MSFLTRGALARISAVIVFTVGFSGVGLSSAARADECTVMGTSSADVLVGTGGSDVICGGGGDDIIYGAGGDDTIRGDDGNDTVYAGDGNDTVDGGNGDDTVYGDLGANALVGGNGADILVGGDGPDHIDGGNGDDRIAGGEGDDDLAGGNGQDYVDGGSGDDLVDGGTGKDVVLGGSGVDTVLGGEGVDYLRGGAALDSVDGGPGRDVCGDLLDATVSCETQSEESSQDSDDIDGDGVPNAIELLWRTDPLAADSDGDGIVDGDEIATLSDPLLRDSNGDGVLDGDEDTDGDGIANAVEVVRGTNPARSDTDRDSIPDGDEIAAGTDPTKADSDGDGLSDSAEITLGTDPNAVDSDGDGTSDASDTFSRTVVADGSGATLQIEAPGATILDVELVDSSNTSYAAIPGLVSMPVEVRGAADAEGTLTIPFDTSGIEPGARLAVLHVDEVAGTVDFPANQHVDIAAAVATVTTSDFSPIVVVDLDEFELAWQQDVATPGDTGTRSPVDVVVIVDSSYSMRTADPDWARFYIAQDVINGLSEGDKVGLRGTTIGLIQTPSTDHQLALSGLYQLFSYYTSDLTRELNYALGNLDDYGVEGHERAIVLISNGYGSFSPSVITAANASNTTIYTIAIGTSADVPRLESMASGTGGTFAPWGDADAIESVITRLGVQPSGPLDSDGDGLSDATEIGGIRSYLGAVYHTDPYNPDTDGDGMEDGAEAGEVTSHPIYPGATAYRVLSDPTDVDSDDDALNDSVEVSNLLYAFDANYDHDGLNDYDEWITYGTDPIAADTDADGFNDIYEVVNADQGFDALIYDDSYEWWEYLGDFSRGALCGSITVGSFCEGTTIAFLTGQIAAGFAMVGDVRDFLSSTVTGDAVGASLSAFGVIPFVGDAAKTSSQIAKFTKRLGDTPQVALRFLGRSTSFPASLRIKALDEAFDGAASALKPRGLDDDVILAFARRGMSPRHVSNMLDSAKNVVRGSGKFAKEIDAEDILRKATLDADAFKFASKNSAGEVRFYDVTSRANRVAFEVKHGKVPFSGRARVQAQRDADYLKSLPEEADFGSVTWVFYADRTGVVGPDEALLAYLIENRIPYLIHLP